MTEGGRDFIARNVGDNREGKAQEEISEGL